MHHYLHQNITLALILRTIIVRKSIYIHLFTFIPFIHKQINKLMFGT